MTLEQEALLAIRERDEARKDLLVLRAPFVFVGEIQALCALLDAQMDPVGKAMTIFGGGTISLFIFIGRHG